MYIDATLYPDVDPPSSLTTDEDRADYVHRVCGAFDQGLVPEEATIELLSGWRRVFDRFPVRTSPGYHALRSLFGWPAVDRAPFYRRPVYALLDRIEERDDGFEDWV